MTLPVDPAEAPKPKRRRARNAAALAAAFAAGAASAVAVAPPKADPLGAWHYAELPVRVCFAQDGAGEARAVVRPEIVTASGARVHVPEFKATRAEFFSCRETLAKQLGVEAQSPAMDLCFDRSGQVDLEGRVVARVPEDSAPFPACAVEAFKKLVEERSIR